MPPLKDAIGARLRVLFVGINPGLRSAATGHHFAGPSNRFWRLLADSGLLTEPLNFEQDWRLPEWDYGLTNLVSRATSGSSELSRVECARGGRRLVKKISAWRPEIVAPVGVSVWRALAEAAGLPAVARAPVALGLQEVSVAAARVFVLPNPSGRNAHFSYAEMLEAFTGLRRLLGP